MATLDRTIGAFLAAREYDRATMARLRFWSEQFGYRELGDITADEVDAAVNRLAERGRLQPIRNGATTKAGRPLSGATLNRYISQLQSLFKCARRLRLLPRAHIPPRPTESRSLPRSRTPTATCGRRKSSA